MNKSITIFIIVVVVVVAAIGLWVVYDSADEETTAANESVVANSNISATTPAPNSNISATNVNDTVVELDTDAVPIDPNPANAVTDSEVVPITEEPAVEPEPVLSSSASVSVSKSGFFASTVTISVGGTVTWTNSGSSTIYVAADFHPSHTKYPGTWDDDGMGRISPGKTYSHTFNTAGTYQYHDHLRAGNTGTVVVQ